MSERKRVTDAELERVQTVFAGWGASLHGVSVADIIADLRDLRKAAAPFVPTYPLPAAEDDEERRAVGFIGFGQFAYVVTAGDLRRLAEEVKPGLSDREKSRGGKDNE